MAVTDWIANIFQSNQTRGLSGGAAGLVALDDSNPYYNYRLRRHTADGDLISEPGLLWHTSAYVTRRAGLGSHVASQAEGQTLALTDALVILSHEDFSRARSSDSGWFASTTELIREALADLCAADGLHLAHPERELGVRFLCDGSAEMGGDNLGLSAGEFVTGMLPNLYTGPVQGSEPIVGVLLNLPGVWEGYREVGRLYSDQILFTIGSHWLDNFSHPSLAESALYRLQRYPDGSFVHLINPDLQDRYQVTSTEQDGASVLTVATRDGDPIAYMVLAVLEGEELEEDDTPEVAAPMMVEERPRLSRRTASSIYNNKTIIPEAMPERIFTLQERGALLQKVHFGAFMEGYDVFLDARGQMGTSIDNPAGVFEVRRRSVEFRAVGQSAVVGGQELAPGMSIAIAGDTVIEVAGQRFDYRDLRLIEVPGWPYVGEIRRPASSTYMMWGEQYRVGRSRECRVTLPDEPRNDNIRWKASVGEGATIRARSGDIPKSNFYTDSIMVASEHAEVDLAGDDAVLRCMARHCYSYIRRGGQLLELYPSKSEKDPTQRSLQPGDEILIGNCLFQVGFPPAEEAVLPAPAPKLSLTPADELVGAVSLPDVHELDQTRADPSELADEPTPPPAPLVDDEDDEPQPEWLPPEPRKSRMPSLSDAPVPRRSVLPSNRRSLSSSPFALPKPKASGKYADAPTVLQDGDEDDFPELPSSGEESEDMTPGVLGRVVARGQRAPVAEEPPPLDVFDDEATDTPEPPALPEFEEPPPLPESEEPPAFEPPPISEPEPFEPELPEPPPMPSFDEPPAAPPPPPYERPTGAPSIDMPAPPPIPGGDLGESDEYDLGDGADPVEVEVDFDDLDDASSDHGAEDAVEPPILGHLPPPDDLPGGNVVVVDDSEAQFELSRRMQLVCVGWMVKGELSCGNHDGADLVIPENRIEPDQSFSPADYFTISARGRKRSLTATTLTELYIDGQTPGTAAIDPGESTLDIVRRDDLGDEDFLVRLSFKTDKRLPDPRASLLALDVSDPLAAALFTRGLPAGTPRELELGGMQLTATHDGDHVVISGYLAAYRTESGFRPFFVQHGDARFQTAPEDGADIALSVGDRLVLGHAVYELTEG